MSEWLLDDEMLFNNENASDDAAFVIEMLREIWKSKCAYMCMCLHTYVYKLCSGIY